MAHAFLWFFAGHVLGLLALDMWAFGHLSHLWIFLLVLAFVLLLEKNILSSYKKRYYLFLTLFILAGGFRYASQIEISSPVIERGVLTGKVISSGQTKQRGGSLTTIYSVRGSWNEGEEKKYRLYLKFSQKMEVPTRFRAEGRLFPFPQPRNPGEFNYRRWQQRRGVRALVMVKKPRNLSLISNPLCLSSIAREMRQKALDKCRILSPSSRDLMATLLLGKRMENYRDYQKTGTAHFFAISGLHMGLLFVLFWFVFRLCGFSRRLSLGGAFLAITFYLPLTGARLPALRAWIMIGLLVGGEIWLWPRNSWNCLGLAASLLLFLWPWQLFEVGFLLSVGAVAGILGLYPLFSKCLARRENWWSKTRGLFLVSASAWLINAPLVAYFFGAFSLFSALNSTLLFPFVFYFLVTGFFFLLIATLTGKVAGLVVPLVEVGGWALGEGNGLLGHLGGYLPVFTPTPAGLLFFYVALCLFVFPRKVPRWIFHLFVLLALVFFIAGEIGQKKPQLTVFDVGHGQAAFLRTPSGRNLLFDGGSYRRKKVGENLLSPYFRRQRINRVDAIFLSHSHRDHINGLMPLIHGLSIGLVVVPPTFGENQAGREVLQILVQKGIPYQKGRAGMTFKVAPGERVEILGPPRLKLPLAQVGINDRSLVAKVKMGELSLLFPGDIEEWGTNYLLEREKSPRAQILVIPHHGRPQRLTEELLEGVEPSIAIQSGQKPMGKEEKKLYHTRGIRLFSTGEVGALTFWAEKGTWRGRGFLEESPFPSLFLSIAFATILPFFVLVTFLRRIFF